MQPSSVFCVQTIKADHPPTESEPGRACWRPTSAWEPDSEEEARPAQDLPSAGASMLPQLDLTDTPSRVDVSWGVTKASSFLPMEFLLVQNPPNKSKGEAPSPPYPKVHLLSPCPGCPQSSEDKAGNVQQRGASAGMSFPLPFAPSPQPKTLILAVTGLLLPGLSGVGRFGEVLFYFSPR